MRMNSKTTTHDLEQIKAELDAKFMRELSKLKVEIDEKMNEEF